MNRPTAVLLLLLFAIASAVFAEHADTKQSKSNTFHSQRQTMVERYIVSAGVRQPSVLQAMRITPRHEFVPQRQRRQAYRDLGLPIGHGQTISSPYIVALMTSRLAPQATDRVLEIGTGSGYQAAVLSPLVKDVYTIEIVPELGRRAQETLQRIGYENVHVRIGDGYQGWKEHAPFDKIIVTCSPEDIPQPLVDQLVDGGHLVIPMGERYQQTLFRFTKRNGQLERERLEATFFVPMTGRAEAERDVKTSDTAKLLNGDFETATENVDEPRGWYYIRRGVLKGHTHETGQYMSFQKQQIDQRAHALQSFGIDGRRVSKLTVGLRSKGDRIHAGPIAIHAAQVVVEFYGEDRASVGQGSIPIRAGSFDWTKRAVVMKVPPEARLAAIGVGLFSVTGELEIDDVTLQQD